MIDLDRLEAAARQLCATTRESDDGARPSVAAAATACEGALATWTSGGRDADDLPSVFSTSDDLLDELYAGHPEGLRREIRDVAMEMLFMLDEAKDAGLMPRPGSPAP